MASIQFYGVQAVCKAAENIKVPKWGIFCGKQFLFKYEGNDEADSLNFLSEILETIEHSTAVYTLKFYEDAGKIKENTPCDGSFNFRLVDEDTRAERQKSYSAASNEVLNEIKALNQRLDEIEEEKEEIEPGGIGGIMLGLLKEPEKIETLLNIGKSLLGFKSSKPTGALGNVQQGSDDERILRAIQTLRDNDPKLIEHLEKLAVISQTNKATFSMLTGMLDKM